MFSIKKFLLNEITGAEHYEKYMKPKYSGMSLNTYNIIAQMDPTAKPDSRGKYVEWLIKIYSTKAKLFSMDIDKYVRIKQQNFPVESTKNRLIKYDKHPQKKDINTFKTLSQLFDYIDSLPITGKELKKQDKEIFTDTYNVKIIDSNEKWIIATPLTHEGSKKLAYYKVPHGADWCTARKDNPRAFDDYNEHGILLIFINKQTPTEKYQAYFSLETFQIEEVKDAGQNDVKWVALVDYIGDKYIGQTLKYISQFKRKNVTS